MINISEHITYDEATKSPTAMRNGIDNIPDDDTLFRMQTVAKECFEPARKIFGPIKVNSFYRCRDLNKLVGGSLTSQHVKGEAIDMDLGDRDKNEELFNWCKKNLIFDQLINEYDFSWVHISFCSGQNRNQTLVVVKTNHL